MSATLAKDGEVGLVYRKNGTSYAVALTREQHEMLQIYVGFLGKIAADTSKEVDFVEPLTKTK